MKVGLNVPKNIGGKVFPAGCVVDLFDSEALALIASGEGSAVPDGTMARKKAYGVPGCMAPVGFESNIAEAFSRIAVNIANSESNESEGTRKDKKGRNKNKH